MRTKQKSKAENPAQEYLRNVERLKDTASSLHQTAERLHTAINNTEDNIHRTRIKYENIVEKQRKRNQKRIES